METTVELGKRNAPEQTTKEEQKVKHLQPAQASIKQWQMSGKLTAHASGKKPKHPKSLWYDESLVPRDLEDGETIFNIVMPWVKEKEEEEKKEFEVTAKAAKKGP